MITDTLTPRPNPYVGPRAFQTGERLYGRDRDILNLHYLFLAERVVLLFSPSGAGKTSLIQAGLIPKLKEKFGFIPVIRVNQEPPESLRNEKSFNRYTFSTLLSLEETLPDDERSPVKELAELTLSVYLTQRFQSEKEPDQESEQAKPVFEALIFDQFEEILTTDPNDYDGKKVFFDQLGEALGDSRRWALFSTREDYVAAFEPYQAAIPTRFANHYRLDFLRAESALEAIQKPAREAGVEFTDNAARKLIDDLRQIQVQRLDGTLEAEQGRYVEPVQLQVVCYRLWNSLSSDEAEITEKHISSVGSVDESLSAYYAEQVSLAEERYRTPERLMREWFNDRLITKQGTRGQVMLEPEKSSGLDNDVIRFMESAHLVRAEKRAGSTWFELTHDRLIEPLRTDNEKWSANNLSLLQQQASVWQRQNRPESLLLRDKELAASKLWAEAHQAELLPVEVDFLAASVQQEARELRRKQQNRIISVLGIAAMVLAAISFLAFRRANIQSIEAQKQELLARSGQLAAQSQALLEENPQRSLLLAIEANSAMQPGEQSPASAEEALRATLKDPHGLPLPGHEELVNALAFSSDGRWLATGSQDGTVRLWDVSKLPQSVDPQILSEHESEVIALAFSPDGRWLATGGADGTARLWDLQSATPVDHPVVLSGHKGSIFTLAFSPDRHWLATGGADGTARLWNLDITNPDQDPLVFASQDGWVQILAFSPDGRLLATGGPQTVWLWHLDDPDPASSPTILSGHDRLVRTLGFSPDGRWLASGSEDATARLWDLNSPDPVENSYELSGHSDWVNALAFSPDGRWLATGSGDNTARLWDMSTLGESINSIVLPGHTGPIRTLTFSPDGLWLVTGGQDHTVRLWDVNADAPAVNPRVFRGHDNWVNALAFNPDGRWLATGSQDGDVRLWDQVYTDLNENPLVLRGHEGGIRTLAFSQDNHWLATGGADATVRLWYVNAGNLATDGFILRRHTGWINTLTFSSDGRWLASAGGDQKALLWDLESSQLLESPIELSGHSGEILSMVFSPDGRWLATGGAEGISRLWDLNAPNPSAAPIELRGHTDGITALAFSPDGHWLATGSADNTVRLWDLTSADIATNSIELTGHRDDILTLAFSPNGRWLATGSGDFAPAVLLWDLRSSNPADTPKELPGHTKAVSALAFSPDGHWLATGSWDSTARLWDLSAADPAANPKILVGHEDWVNTLAFSPDNRWLATGSADKTVRLWDLQSGNLEQSFLTLTGHEDGINTLAFSPDGRWLATGGEDGTARLWLMQLDDMLRMACQSAGRNFTQLEWGQYFPGGDYRKTCEQWPLGR
ncbi:MAG: WD40 repeat domain-containing protein [Anaerolineales bacterium]